MEALSEATEDLENFKLLLGNDPQWKHSQAMEDLENFKLGTRFRKVPWRRSLREYSLFETQEEQEHKHFSIQRVSYKRG